MNKIVKFLIYTTIKLIIGLAILWFFIDYLIIPVSNTIVRTLLYLVWLGISFFVYDKKIFKQTLTVEACERFLKGQS